MRLGDRALFSCGRSLAATVSFGNGAAEVEASPEVVKAEQDVLLLRYILPAFSPGRSSDRFKGLSVGLFPSAAMESVELFLPKRVYIEENHPALRETGDRPDPSVRLNLCSMQSGDEPFSAHYLEPRGSSDTDSSRHPLLLPVCIWGESESSLRIGLFASPEKPWSFSCRTMADGHPRILGLTRCEGAGDEGLECFLAVSLKGEDGIYRCFHECRDDRSQPPGWLNGVKVHYFDFLSPEKPGGKRGKGFEASLPHFKEFRVGLATVHGYYPHWGDYIHPERECWTAMKGDDAGPVAMSLDVLRTRRDAARKTGSRFGMYLHLSGFDTCSPLWETLRHAVRHTAPGTSSPYPWQGPDMEGPAAYMSIACREWADHLLQQAQWLMELIDPDAIVLDETFGGIGFDYHPEHAGCCSGAMIAFIKQLRSLVRSFGEDKALLTSDCGLGAFSLWADGEAGDSAYDFLLQQPSFRRKTGGYTSVLNGKPWIPCAWHGVSLWDEQMELARTCGAGVGLGHGWLEYTGLYGLPEEIRMRILHDIRGLRS